MFNATLDVIGTVAAIVIGSLVIASVCYTLFF
jgi:hypothetical protein